MNSLNKKSFRSFFLLMLTVLFFTAAFDASAQNKKKKERSIEDIPENVLQPTVTDSFIKRHFESFTEWATAPYKKGFKGASVELKPKDTDVQKLSAREIQEKRRAAKKAGLKYEPEKPKGRVVTLSTDEFEKQFMLIKMFVANPTIMDDVEEATGIKRSWYQNVVNAAQMLQQPVYQMTAAKGADNEERYNAVFEIFQKQAKKFESVANSKPTKLSDRELKFLKEKNLQRRANAYWIAQDKNKARKKAESAVREKDAQK